jgi:hypothetical protein
VLKSKAKSDILPYYSFENMKVNIEGNLAVSGQGKLYIVKDEFIFLTVQFMGFEINRALITQDSIYYINRLTRKYAFHSFKDIQKKHSKYINYELAQNMVLRGLPLPGRVNSRHLLRFMTISNNQYVFNISGDGKSISLFYDKGLQLENMTLIDTESGIRLNSSLNYKPGLIDVILAEGIFGGNRLKAIINFGDLSFQKISRPSMNVNRTYGEISF